MFNEILEIVLNQRLLSHKATMLQGPAKVKIMIMTVAQSYCICMLWKICEDHDRNKPNVLVFHLFSWKLDEN